MDRETNTAVLDAGHETPLTTAEMVDYEIDRFERHVRTSGEAEGLPLTAILTANTANDDPAAARHVMLIAGLYYARAKRLAAEHEAGRKAQELVIREAIMSEKGVSATAAKELVRDDPRYTAYADEGRLLDYERDVAEVLYDTLKENARALRAGALPMASITLGEVFERVQRNPKSGN